MWRGVRERCLDARLSILSAWSCCIPNPASTSQTCRTSALFPLGRTGFGSKQGVRTFRSDNSFRQSLHPVRDPRITITGTVTDPGERCRRCQWSHLGDIRSWAQGRRGIAALGLCGMSSSSHLAFINQIHHVPSGQGENRWQGLKLWTVIRQLELLPNAFCSHFSGALCRQAVDLPSRSPS